MTAETKPTTLAEDQTDHVWLISCFLITAAGTFLRFVWLGLKPFHHDEGVNGWFLTNLFRDGIYKYDPANYHGPTLYYIALAFTEAFGLDTVPVRWSVAVWGVLIVVLAFYLRRYIGRFGALAAAFFLAVSPGMVFISRYFIHETFFVFLGFAFVLAVLFFIERRPAGPVAVGWISLILFVCFLPPVVRFPEMLAGEYRTIYWAALISFLALEAALIFYLVRLLTSWNEGRPIYFLLASACVALLFATKETTFITLGTMLAACVCIRGREMIADAAQGGKFPFAVLAAAEAGAIAAVIALVYKLPEVAADFGKRTADAVPIAGPEATQNFLYFAIIAIPALLIWIFYVCDRRIAKREVLSRSSGPTFADFREMLGAGSERIYLLSAAAAIFVYLLVLFFSSIFTYWDGVSGFFEAYAIWTKTGSKDHTQNGFWAYLDWGIRSDGPIMVLAAAGALTALIKGSRRFAMFAGLWSFGLFAAYTIIPYKTPWLALSFLLPMCISAGYAINELAASKNSAVRLSAGLLALAAAAILTYQTYDLNFVRYDDEDAPMVYAHTQREFLDMVRDIEHFADASGKGKDAAIDIVSPDYWPLVWYLKDYPKAIFHGHFIDNSTAEMIVAKKGEQDDEVIRKYSARYDYYASYKLRSGVDLMLLVRKDIAGSSGDDLFKIRMP